MTRCARVDELPRKRQEVGEKKRRNWNADKYEDVLEAEQGALQYNEVNHMRGCD